MRKITRKGFVRKLDTLTSRQVIARDKYCVTCGTREHLTNGHLFSRVAYSTRWDLDNCYCQCVSCNYRHEFDAYPLMKYAEKILGKKKLAAVHQKYRTVKKYKTYELEELFKKMGGGI